jgi:hypothetical protein
MIRKIPRFYSFTYFSSAVNAGLLAATSRSVFAAKAALESSIFTGFLDCFSEIDWNFSMIMAFKSLDLPDFLPDLLSGTGKKETEGF